MVITFEFLSHPVRERFSHPLGDEETEDQRGEATCPGSHSLEVAE